MSKIHFSFISAQRSLLSRFFLSDVIIINFLQSNFEKVQYYRGGNF